MRAKSESTITSLRVCNLIVLVESEIKHKILPKNIEKTRTVSQFKKKKCARKIIVSLLVIYRGIDSE